MSDVKQLYYYTYDGGKQPGIYPPVAEMAKKVRIAMELKNLPTLKEDGSLVAVGTRINWNGTIKRAAVDLWDRAEHNPDNAPTLWEDDGYKDGIRIIPERMSLGSAFDTGEQGWWGDTLYASKIMGNVWTPEQYPDGWELVEV